MLPAQLVVPVLLLGRDRLADHPPVVDVPDMLEVPLELLEVRLSGLPRDEAVAQADGARGGLQAESELAEALCVGAPRRSIRPNRGAF